MVNLLVYVSGLKDPINLWYNAGDSRAAPYITPSMLPNGNFEIRVSDIRLPRLLPTQFAVQVFSTTDLHAQDARPNETLEVGPSDMQYKACWLALYEVGPSAFKLPKSLVDPGLLGQAVKATEMTLKSIEAIDTADKCNGIQACIDDTTNNWIRDILLTVPDAVAGKLGLPGFLAVLAKNAIVALPELASCAEWYADQQIKQTKEMLTSAWNTGYKFGTLISTIVVKSPAYPLVVDSAGRRAGFLPDGTIVQEIPDSLAVEVGDKRIVIAPSGSKEVRLTGYALGTMGIYAVLSSEASTGEALSAEYNNVPVSPGMIATIDTSDAQRILSIDTNGDGQVDQSRTPDSIESVSGAPVTIPNVPSGNSYSFPQTGFLVADRFWDVWQAGRSFDDSLYLNGLPLTPMQSETNLTDGKVYQTQWFERARFELHPENQPPYDVLLGLLGAAAAQGRQNEGPSQTVPNPGNGLSWFPETGHTVGDTSAGGLAIAAFWNNLGGLQQFGFPLSQPFMEQSKDDGNTYLVQYFERQRFEYHPENKGTRYEVLLGRLGSEQVAGGPSKVPEQPQNIFGPVSGELVANQTYSRSANVNIKNVSSEVRFYNPYELSDSKPLILSMNLRATSKHMLSVGIEWGSRPLIHGWSCSYYDRTQRTNSPILSGSLPTLNKGNGEANTIRVETRNEIGTVFINSVQVGTCDLSSDLDAGDVSISVALGDNGSVIHYDNFTIKALPSQEEAKSTGAITVANAQQLTIVRTLQMSKPDAVVFSPDAKNLAVGSFDYTYNSGLQIWPTEGQTSPRILPGQAGSVIGLAYSPDQRFLASISIGPNLDQHDALRVWKVSDGVLVLTRPIRNGTGSMQSLAFSPNGQTLAVAYSQIVEILRVSDWTLASTLSISNEQTGGIRRIAFSPDGRLLATAGQSGVIQLWNVTDNRLLNTLNGNGKNLWDIAFSPDGQILASSALGTTEEPEKLIRLWRVQDGTILRTLTGHAYGVWNVAFSPDGQILASVSVDGTLRLWRTADGTQLVSVDADSRTWADSSNLAFSPDGKMIATTNTGHTIVRLWGIR